MTAIRNDARSSTRHQQAIEALARENSVSIDHVRELYEVEHAKLDAGARVKTFVAVIATRLVRKVLVAERSASV